MSVYKASLGIISKINYIQSSRYEALGLSGNVDFELLMQRIPLFDNFEGKAKTLEIFVFKFPKIRQSLFSIAIYARNTVYSRNQMESTTRYNLKIKLN